MKLSSIREPIVEWPNRKPDPGYGLSDVSYSHFKYYIGKIKSELSTPINIPANYVELYNTVNKTSKIDLASLQEYLNNYISNKFAGASEFKGYTRLATRMPSLPSGHENYEFNITQKIIEDLVPGENKQKIYNDANKQLRLYYFGVIRNDPAKAQAEEQRQVQEDINLLFSTINEDSNFYSMKARAFYYNILLTKKFIELLLNQFCDNYRSGASPETASPEAAKPKTIYSTAYPLAMFSQVPFKQTPKLLIKLLTEYPKSSVYIIDAAPENLRSIIKSTIRDKAFLPEDNLKRIYVEKIASVIGTDEYLKLCKYLGVSESSEGYPEPRDADEV